jgi:hypothetical protein
MNYDPEIVLDAEKHEYTVDGVVFPSVTQIIKPVQPFIPKALLEAGGARGMKVHEACEFIDAGFDDDVDPEVRGYADGYKRFLADSGAKVLRSEFRVANPAPGYAGTIDRVIQWGDDTIVLDLKSGEMHPWMRLQLAAYAYAYWTMTSGDTKVALPKCMALQLFEDGTYRAHEYRDPKGDFFVFLGLARFYRWKETAA